MKRNKKRNESDQFSPQTTSLFRYGSEISYASAAFPKQETERFLYKKLDDGIVICKGSGMLGDISVISYACDHIVFALQKLSVGSYYHRDKRLMYARLPNIAISSVVRHEKRIKGIYPDCTFFVMQIYHDRYWWITTVPVIILDVVGGILVPVDLPKTINKTFSIKDEQFSYGYQYDGGEPQLLHIRLFIVTSNGNIQSLENLRKVLAKIDVSSNMEEFAQQTQHYLVTVEKNSGVAVVALCRYPKKKTKLESPFSLLDR